jgi:hypothetical protein
MHWKRSWTPEGKVKEGTERLEAKFVLFHDNVNLEGRDREL